MRVYHSYIMENYQVQEDVKIRIFLTNENVNDLIETNFILEEQTTVTISKHLLSFASIYGIN